MAPARPIQPILAICGAPNFFVPTLVMGVVGAREQVLMLDYLVFLRWFRLARFIRVRDHHVQQFGGQGSLDPPRAIETWIMLAGMLAGMLSLFLFSVFGMAVGGAIFLVGFLFAVFRALAS
jgi:hypothetical protein